VNIENCNAAHLGGCPDGILPSDARQRAKAFKKRSDFLLIKHFPRSARAAAGRTPRQPSG